MSILIYPDLFVSYEKKRVSSIPSFKVSVTGKPILDQRLKSKEYKIV